MKSKLFFIFCVLFFGINLTYAQPSHSKSGKGKPDEGVMSGLDMNSLETSFVLDVNYMNVEKKEKLNKVALNCRSRDRGIIEDFGTAMLGGGITAIVNVVGTEIINLTKIRSKQRKAWEEMRQKECIFIDSLQSVKGQSDFYGKQSDYGPLDPSDMNFDGITLRANRGGKEVLKMVCHIDTTKYNHLFLHSKFYLVLDTLVFHPYRSFLPNLKANHIERPRVKDKSRKKGNMSDEQQKEYQKTYWATQDELDYWNTISQFSFEEHKTPTINIKMDMFSSWVNELVQVYQDIKLGTFSVSIPINENDLNDSVYFYCREQAIANNQPTINVDGDCFIVPRSYMPVSANNPSWGTGEYKMKVVLSEKCKYNPKDKRSKKWHRDYKQLIKMQKHGKAKNEYWSDIVTTFRDNKSAILKATYTPALNKAASMLSLVTSGGTGASGSTPASSGTSTGGKMPPQKQ